MLCALSCTTPVSGRMFMEKSLCDSHGKCVFSFSRPRRRRRHSADVCNFFCDASLTFFFLFFGVWNTVTSTEMFLCFLSHISQTPGSASLSWYRIVRFVINGQVGELNMECLKCFTFFSSAHLCYDINQMLEVRLPPQLWEIIMHENLL